MTCKFIKKVTSEGERRVINVPKKIYDKVKVGDDILCEKVDLDKLKNDTSTI